jgi:hypothetical protein
MSRFNRLVVAAVLVNGVIFTGGVVGANPQPAPRGVCTKVGDVVSTPVPLVCKQTTQNGLRWRKVPTTTTTTTTTTSVAPSTTVAVAPSVSLAATFLDSGTFPKAAVVTTNVAGTVYFIEGASPVNTVSDITSARYYRWTSGVVAANTPTSIALDVDVLTNGYYRVFVANSQGVLSEPAFNKVTISITRQAETVAVRRQTLDQSYPTWHTGGSNVVFSATQSIGQSFKAGLSGPLSRIAVGMTRSGTVTQITAEIYLASGGNATGSALATKTIVGTIVPTSSGGALTVFDFASPVSVVSGSQYVIVMTTPDRVDPITFVGGSYRWYFLNGNSYADGNGIANPKTAPSLLNDVVFQTYVDVE